MYYFIVRILAKHACLLAPLSLGRCALSHNFMIRRYFVLLYGRTPVKRTYYMIEEYMNRVSIPPTLYIHESRIEYSS